MSTVKATTLSNLAGTQTVPVDTVAQGSAKAWVNFNGTGTVAIRASFNVSSITDNGTGNYTVNFTNAMPDANYGFSVNRDYGGVPEAVAFARTGYSTTSITVISGYTYTSPGYQDSTSVSVSIFR